MLRVLIPLFLSMACLFTLVNFAFGSNESKVNISQFAIYESNSTIPPYDRDAKWQAFYEYGELTKKLVSDQDIEAYDWDNQAIILTQEASKRIHDQSKNFITTLDNKRLYGGKCINRISQMAIRYPVIYTVPIEGRTVLLVRPEHDFGKKPQLENQKWQALTPRALMEHFAATGKLRHPWANDKFRDLQKNVHRVRNLSAKTIRSALSAEYDLAGERTGDYTVTEALSWKVGNESCNLGPSKETVVSLRPGTVHRKVDFPFAEIVNTYKYSHTPQLQDNRTKPIEWEITVTLSPVFSKGDASSIGLVERINLDLVRGYGGDLFRLLEHQSAEQWSSLQDMKIATLPMDWNEIERAR